MFQKIVLEEQDFMKADRLGKALKLNVGALYEKMADLKLAEGQVTAAVRLYQLARVRSYCWCHGQAPLFNQ